MDSLTDTPTLASLHVRLFKLYQKAISENSGDRGKLLGRLDNLAGQATQAGLENHDSLILRYRRLIDLGGQMPRPAPAEQAQATPGPADPGSLPLVLTSINPFGRGALQLRCFLKWLDLGFDAYTCNHGIEKEALCKLGVPGERIIQLGDHETGKQMFDKPVPKIKAVLARAEATFDKDLLLVNSDLYPAAEDTGFLAAWRENGNALALTREDVLSLDHPVRRICHPYRGGLDAFLLSRKALAEMLETLTLFPVSNRMCFGVLGWDYFVGALLERRLGGTFADSHILFHEMHKPTYSNVDEFRHYLSSIQALGVGLGKDHMHAAMEFAQTIDQLCMQNIPERRPPELLPQLDEGEAALSDEQRDLLEELTTRMPDLVYAFGRLFVASLIGGIAGRSDVTFSGMVERIPDTEYKRGFAQALLIFLLFLRLREAKNGVMTLEYPKGNMHATSVRLIRDNTCDNPDRRRLEVAKLFCTEAADYKIFNPRLFNILALSCENDGERTLVSEIWNSLSGKIKDAA